jgi:hypothetical protein
MDFCLYLLHSFLSLADLHILVFCNPSVSYTQIEVLAFNVAFVTLIVLQIDYKDYARYKKLHFKGQINFKTVYPNLQLSGAKKFVTYSSISSES